MANLQYLPITLVGSIQNGSVSSNTFYNNAGSIYDGYGYTFNATLNILLTFNSDDRTTPTPNVYDANQIVPGMWFGQGNGLAYRIESIVSLNSNTQIEVILKDVGLFNLLSDSSFSGINTPIENNNGIIFNLSEDGDPIISGIEFLRPNLPDISYWINDFYARFQYRNFTTTHYNNNDTNLVYGTGYSVNQIVYLDSTGQFQLVDTTNSTQVEKSFGIITSVNEPEDGNMTVKPFGEIKGGLTLTGFSIGDILYYDATASSTSFVTNVKPTTNSLPIYIKISDTTGSLIGGQTSGGGSSGVSGTSGTSGTDGTSGDSLFAETGSFWVTTNDVQITGSLNVDGTITARELHITYETSSVLYTSGSNKFGNTIDDTHQFTGSLFISGSVNITSGSLYIDGVAFSAMTSGTSGSNGTDGSSGTSGVDGTSGSNGTDGTSGSNGTDGSSGTSGSDGSSGSNGTDGSSGTSGVDGVSGTSGTSGSNGTDGTSGISGVDGTDGSSGTSGSSGISGVDGTDGTSGSNGTDGSSGTSGDSLFAETGSFWATTNDIQITGSLTVGQGTGVVNSYLFLTDSSSLILTSGSNIIVENGGTVSASFIGDGAGLYNIPASGVTGLELNKIVSGSVSASIQSDGTFRVNGDTYIDGILTARELHIDYVTSSVLYTSGSNKFGNTSDDTHQFTGSVFISGSVNITSGSLLIDGVSFSAMTSGTSGSNGTDGSSGSNGTDGSSGTSGVDGVSGTSGTSGSNGTDGSSGSNGTDGSSGTSGVDGVSGTSGTSGSNGTDGSSGSSGISGVDGTDGSSGSNGTDGSSGSSGSNGTDGSSGSSGSNGTDGSSGTSGSNGTDGSSGTSGSNGTDGSSGTSGVDGVSGTSGTSGSNGTDGTSGDSLFSEVTSGVWTTTNDVLITGSLFVSNTVHAESGSFNYIHTIYETASVIYSSGSTKFGDTFDDTHNFTGSVNITGSITLNGQAVGVGKLDETAFNAYTSSITSSFSGTSSYAIYAENAVIVSGANKQLYVSSPSTTWSFTHNLHERYPVINVFDSNGYIVVPETIRSVNQDLIEVYFNTPETGHIVASVGGAGTSGTSGSNGTDGSSGSNGTDGSSGTSGVDGVSGTSGTSGSNGTDGTSGSSGISGVDGTDGSSGISGVNGTDGSSGTSGDSLFAKTGSFWATTNDIQFTGSLRTTGSVTIDGDLIVRGTTTLTATDALRESLIISGAMAIMNAQIQSQIISASISMQNQLVISHTGSVNVMDLGGF